jgi:hypothetical protein
MPAKIEPAKYRHHITKKIVKVTETAIEKWRTRSDGVYIELQARFVHYEKGGQQFAWPEHAFRQIYGRI